MKIAIIGYGKMGHIIEEIALSRGHEIVCAIDRIANGTQTVLRTDRAQSTKDQSAGFVRLFSPEEGFQSKEFKNADVAIEFSTPATAEKNIRAAWSAGVPVVSGTTGWTFASAIPKDWKSSEAQNRIEIKNAEGKTMLVWSSNFSVGVNIFFELNKQLAKAMSEQPQYMPSIKEIHHIHKLDKPSGTAVTLANQIAQTDNSVVVKATDGSALPKNYEFSGTPIFINGISIESIREGEVPGTHEVTWDSEEDTIVITHIAKGRRGFGLGAVLAAEKIGR